MSIEERVRTTLGEAGARITPKEPGRALTPIAAPSRRRRLRPIVAFLAGAFGVLLLGASALLIGPYDPNAIDPAESHSVATVEIADLAVPVVDAEPILDDPQVWVGLPGPTPQFDTSDLGPDLSFTPGEPADDDLGDRIIDAVYLGDLDDKPFYIYSQTAPSIFDWFSELIFGNLSGQTIGTSLDCCTGGDMDREGGFPGISASQTNDEPPVIVAQWWGLSPDVSVVAYQFDGEFVGWQTPVGGVSAIQPEASPGTYLMIAFDAQGREIDRAGPHNGPVLGDTAAISFLLAQEGVEIQPDEVPTEELRDVMGLDEGDSVFAVPTGEFQVYAVIPETGTPHLYATSRDVLESADLLGAPGTCLERTVNGQRETGVFEIQPERD
jgi:hypothetical protein